MPICQHIIQIGLQSLACELYLLHKYKGKTYLVHKQSHKRHLLKVHEQVKHKVNMENNTLKRAVNK